MDFPTTMLKTWKDLKQWLNAIQRQDIISTIDGQLSSVNLDIIEDKKDHLDLAKSWAQQELKNALVAIEENKKLSICKAGKAYSVPTSTLYDHVMGKVEIGKRSGSPMVLTSVEESMFVDWAIEMSRIRYGMNSLPLVHYRKA